MERTSENPGRQCYSEFVNALKTTVLLSCFLFSALATAQKTEVYRYGPRSVQITQSGPILKIQFDHTRAFFDHFLKLLKHYEKTEEWVKEDFRNFLVGPKGELQSAEVELDIRKPNDWRKIAMFPVGVRMLALTTIQTVADECKIPVPPQTTTPYQPSKTQETEGEKKQALDSSVYRSLVEERGKDEPLSEEYRKNFREKAKHGSLDSILRTAEVDCNSILRDRSLLIVHAEPAFDRKCALQSCTQEYIARFEKLGRDIAQLVAMSQGYGYHVFDDVDALHYLSFKGPRVYSFEGEHSLNVQGKEMTVVGAYLGVCVTRAMDDALKTMLVEPSTETKPGNTPVPSITFHLPAEAIMADLKDQQGPDSLKEWIDHNGVDEFVKELERKRFYPFSLDRLAYDRKQKFDYIIYVDDKQIFSGRLPIHDPSFTPPAWEENAKTGAKITFRLWYKTRHPDLK